MNASDDSRKALFYFIPRTSIAKTQFKKYFVYALPYAHSGIIIHYFWQYFNADRLRGLKFCQLEVYWRHYLRMIYSYRKIWYIHFNIQFGSQYLYHVEMSIQSIVILKKYKSRKKKAITTCLCLLSKSWSKMHYILKRRIIKSCTSVANVKEHADCCCLTR